MDTYRARNDRALEPFDVLAGRGVAAPMHDAEPFLACFRSEDDRAGLLDEMAAMDEPLDPGRVRAIVNAVRPFLRNVDLTDRRDEWVGSRPCTADGLPLIGRTVSPRVFVAGGLGMWGVVLGPLTGQLLAEAIMTGRTPAELAACDPLRSGRFARTPRHVEPEP